jgi:hypothetical protein
VDRVHSTGARVHMTSLNVSCSSGDLRPGLNELKGYPSLLILAVDAGMDGQQQLSWQGRRDCGSAPGPRRRLTGVGCYWRSGAANMMGEKGKTERGSQGCSHRVANGSADDGCISWWRGSSFELGWWRRLDAVSSGSKKTM